MEIIVYPDILFLVNFSVDFFLLCLLRMILRLKGTRLRLILAGTFGAAAAVVMQWIWLSLFIRGVSPGIFERILWLGAALGISGGMVRIAFVLADIRELFRVQAGLLFGAALAEGMVEAGISAAGYGRAGPGTGLGIAALFFSLSGGCLSAGLLWKLMDRALWEKEFYYHVLLVNGGKQVTAKGCLDTGNHLQDPISGKPVHVADRELLKELCPGAEKVRMIPYRTIDGGGSLLTAVVLERMEAVQGKRRLVYEQPLVAASPKALEMKDGCRILLHDG